MTKITEVDPTQEYDYQVVINEELQDDRTIEIRVDILDSTGDMRNRVYMQDTSVDQAMEWAKDYLLKLSSTKSFTQRFQVTDD